MDLNKIYENENNYLSKVLNELKKQISDSEIEIEQGKKETTKYLKYLYQNKTNYEEQFAIKNDMIVRFNKKVKERMKIVAYNKMLNNTYFGKVIFTDELGTENVYIGIQNLSDENYNILVTDWRSPIASLYYNDDIGEAFYEAPEGIIKGEITQKRQIDINNGKLIRVFDTSMQIGDLLLREILSKNATSKMRDIVNTIQKEQNQIIRTNAKTLLVEGTAGSGKTSVALHRAAYLMYKEKDTLNRFQILIISPSDVFSEYVSQVLPSIGVEQVFQTTFQNFITNYIKEFKIISTKEDLLEELLNKSLTNEQVNKINKKMSEDMLRVIDCYIEKIIQDFPFKDYQGVSKAELYKWKNENIKNESVEDIYQIMVNRLQILLSNIYTESKYKPIIKELRNFKFNAKELFMGIFKDDLNIRIGKLRYEDVLTYVYFKQKLLSYKKESNIKYIFIDEAQDLNNLQLEILKNMFPNAKFTILGDKNQSIFPLGSYGVEYPFKDTKEMKLTKTFRSTSEINSFCKKILLSNNEFKHLNRQGKPVEIIKCENLLQEALRISNEGLITYDTIAIITKTEKEIKDLNLKSGINIINKANMTIKKGINFIPSYYAKGLEFDCVIVYNAESSNFSEKDRNLFYVMCSRALHSLTILYKNELVKYISWKIYRNTSYCNSCCNNYIL